MPTSFSQAPHQPEEQHDQNSAEQNTNDQHNGLFPHPRPERLIQEAIFVLAEVAFINREGESDHRHDEDKLHPVQRGLKRPNACYALGQIAHAHGPAEPEQEPHY